MDDPVSERETSDQPPVGGAGFDDPALEAAFGLASPSDWVERARQSETPPPPPGWLGPYELLEEIGHGGQGVVYKAVQPGTRRIIAIKRLPGGHALGTRHRARFTQEVQALVRLHHPSIVAVHGAETIADSPVLLMEYVAGQPIDLWADGPRPGDGRRPPVEVLRVFALVCDAVAHAHQRGVIHRDLKPSNVLVDEAGIPRVLDFGIARLVGDLETRPHDGQTLTCFAGTPAYASPEQLEGSSEADTRTDVYSLGVLLYRLLTGVEPFLRTMSLPALIDAVRNGYVCRPSLACAGLPGELDWVVLKAMDRDPAIRYQTVDSLAADVRRFLGGAPVTAHPPSRMYTATKFFRRHTPACVATGAALAMILTLAGVAIAQAVRVSRQNRSLALAIESESRARKEADAQHERADAQTATQREITEGISRAISEIAIRIPRRPIMSSAELLACIEPEFAKLSAPEDPHSRAQFHALRARLAGAAERHEESAEHWLKAVAAGESAYDADDVRLARLRRWCGESLVIAKRPDEARAEAMKVAGVTDPAERRVGLELLCNIQVGQRDFEGAGATVATLLSEAGSDHVRRAYALDIAAQVKRDQNRPIEARELFEESLVELLAGGRGGSYDAARIRVHIANFLLAEGNPEKAEPLAGAAARVRLARSGPLYMHTEGALLTHAESLLRLGRFAEAAERLEQALPRIEAINGRDSQRTAGHRFRLAAAYLGAGARAEGRRNLAIALSLGASNDPDKPSLSADVRACESAIVANGWQVNRALGASLGPLAWLAENAPDALENRPRLDDSNGRRDLP